MVNLELFRIFVIVAREKTMTRASEILNISQPAITKHIKNLEDELRVTLFIRNRGMKLTEDGKKLYDKIASSIDTLIETENSFLVNKKITFGTYATMLSKVLNESIVQFYKENRNVQINAVTEPFNELFENFLNHKIDIVLLKRQDEKSYNKSKIKYIELRKHRIYADCKS